MKTFIATHETEQSRWVQKPVENVYSPPEIEWEEDLDLEDLPEAGDTGYEERSSR